MANFSRDLGSKVVADGIETADRLGKLYGAACELAQGYRFSKPPDDAGTAELPALFSRLASS